MKKRLVQSARETGAVASIIEVACLLLCLYGVYKSFWMNTVGVSLWLDEAMLASSLIKRSIWNLTSEILEWTQTAPAAWLYLNKLITLVFGNTEFALRLFSVFSYAATLILVYVISKRYFHVRLPMLCSAYIASMSFSLYYSIMFKPYISDGLFTMLTLHAYCRFRQKKGRAVFLGLAWAVFLWFSNPVCFVSGGLIVAEILFALVEDAARIRKGEARFHDLLTELKPWLIISAVILGSFALHYLQWLRPVAVGDVMQNYWKGQNFPLIPRSADDLNKLRAMKEEIFVHFASLIPILIPGLVITLIYGIHSKDRCIIGLYLGLLLMLFASYINRFPVEDRMWYYFYPLASMLFFIGLDKTLHFAGEKNGRASVIAVGLIGLYAITGNNGFERFSDREKVFRPNEETNYEVEYVREHIEADESVYVYRHSVPGFQYKNGYNTKSIGQYENNVIYGVRVLSEGTDYSEELKKITEAHHSYLILSHLMGDEIYGITHDLPQTGWLELVKYEHSTPLFYWTDDIDHAKSTVELSIAGQTEEVGIQYLKVGIRNVGETILNSRFCNLFLVPSDYSSIYGLPEELDLGEYTEIEVQIPKDGVTGFRLVDQAGKMICDGAEIEF